MILFFFFFHFISSSKLYEMLETFKKNTFLPSSKTFSEWWSFDVFTRRNMKFYRHDEAENNNLVFFLTSITLYNEQCMFFGNVSSQQKEKHSSAFTLEKLLFRNFINLCWMNFQGLEEKWNAWNVSWENCLLYGAWIYINCSD